MSTVETVNPATAQTIRKFSEMSPGAIEAAASASATAFKDWRRAKLPERLQCLTVFAAGLRRARSPLAEMITREMGKVLRDSLAEVDKCADSVETLAKKLPEWMAAREYTSDNGARVFIEPLGPLLGIMPWNFPVWQAVRVAIPALAQGNTILLKHAPNTWGVAEFIGELFAQSFPKDAYQNLAIGVGVTEKLIGDPRVRGVSLTGSRRAGQRVGELSGHHLKKCVLELGGSDAYVILEDADIDVAAKACAAGRLVNAGQSCVAAKRFIVTTKNAAAFSEALRIELGRASWGDPLAEATQIGPMARRDLRDELARQVKKSITQGARCVLGGEAPKHAGFFYPATLLLDVKPGMTAFDEELFGPVAAVCVASDEAEAFRLANQSLYGLGGAIFSRDEVRAANLARTEMECGMVAINDFIKSDALTPFGGVKDSGVGRELGREGCFEFTNTKVVR